MIRAIENKDVDLRWKNFSLFEEKDKKYQKSAGDKLCPEDAIKMLHLKYLNSGVNIDKCETCGGIWLDKNEFEAILQYLEQLLVLETAPDYARDAWSKFTEIGSVHDGIISELKDFLVVLKLFEMRIVAEHPTMQTAIEKTLEYSPFN